MADGTANVTNHSAQLATIVAAEAIGYLSNYTVGASLVTGRFSQQFASKGHTVLVPVRGTLTVQTKTPGTAINPQIPTSISSKSVSLDTEKYIDFTIENSLIGQQSTDYEAGYLTDGIPLLGEAIESSILALYGSLTGSAGSAGAAINLTTIAAIRKAMVDAKCPPGDLKRLGGVNVIISSKDEQNLLLDDDMTQAFQLGETQLPGPKRSGEIGRAFGMSFFVSQLVVTTGSAPLNTHNMALHKDAIMLVSAPLPPAPAGLGAITQYVKVPLNPSDASSADSGLVFKVEKTYDPSNKGVRVSIGVLYGVAVLRPELGVHVLS